MTAKHRRQFRRSDLDTPDKAAGCINDALLDVYRRLEAEEDEVNGLGITINNLTPTALTLAAVGSSPNANGASVAFVDPVYTLTLQPADGTNPGVISGANQTISAGTTILTMAETLHTSTLKMSGSTAIQFNASSSNFVRVVGGGGFGTGTNLELGSATGIVLNQQTWVGHQLGAERYSVNTKDDHSGTTGSFTTTAHAGRAAIAAGATGLVITNNTAGRAFAATDDVFWSWIDDDATAVGMKVVSAANTITFTIAGGLTATATTKFAWWVIR